MIKERLALALPLASALALASLPAQGGRRGFRGPPPMPVLEALDLNGDQELSADEMDEAVLSLLTLDTNGDRNLTSDELMPQRGGRRPRGPGGPGGPGGDMFADMPLMKALDKDGDGELFGDEVTDAPRSLDRLDRDDDDVLTEFELVGDRSSSGFGRGFGGARGRGGGGNRYSGVPLPSELKPEDGMATVPDRATFQQLSYTGKEVMIDTHLADQEFVKFQIEDAGGDQPRIYFMNTKTHRAHPMFMQAIGLRDRGPGGRRGRGGEETSGGAAEQSVRMRGVLVYRPRLMSPAGKAGLYTFEFEPNDAYGYELVQVAFDQLQEHAAALDGHLAYNLLPRAKQQWATESDRYVKAALPVFDPEDTYGDVAFLPLHQAVSFGRLRYMKPGERPGPRDITLYDALPNEMPRTAGVLTTCRQTPLSHVNLRAIQDNVPNAYVAGAADTPDIQALIGKYVRYEVSESGAALRQATQAEVDAHFEALRPSEAQTPPRDLTIAAVRAFEGIGFGDAKAFGVKAANLATLHALDLGAATTPDGFAVPFAFYDAFMKHNKLYQRARTMLAQTEFGQDADHREKALKSFRKAIKKGAMPKSMMAALAEVQAQFPDGASIRCRSSTNNEDLEGFSGAGLYDSFTHRPDEGHLGKSIRQVFASLWNFRAFEEREFYRIDHMQAAMGVVLHRNQKGEKVNGVAVAKDVLYQGQHEGMLLYYVNSQSGEDLVTNPNEFSVPEELLLSPRNPGRDRIVQRSNRIAPEQQLLSPEHRQQLRDAMRVLQGRFARFYDKEEDASFAMEIEFKITRDGKLLIKQARPWLD
ncbi:MAG: PEP/pyruvate-binding domain-containing protein [Planctomycetota bacterium]